MTNDAVVVVVFDWRIRHTIATRNGWIGTSRRRVAVIVGLWLVLLLLLLVVIVIIHGE